MTTMNREDLIAALMRWIDERDFMRDDSHASKRQLAADTLGGYSTPMLIELHMSMISNDERSANLMHACYGKSEGWLRTYMMLTYDNECLFSGDRLNEGFKSYGATNSLSLYPTLQFENTASYYRKALALTGVVSNIQYRLTENEGHYWQYRKNARPRLLSYSMDPEDKEEIDRIVRITSDDLVDLIMNRPEDWEAISDIVTERDTDDVDLILSVLDGTESRPLAKGIL
jgi:hypothetical protein